MTSASLRRIATRIRRELPPGTRVGTVPYKRLMSLRLEVAAERLTEAAIAKKFAKGVQASGMITFVALESPPAGIEAYQVTTKRFSIRAYTDFNVVKNRLETWLDVIGGRE